MTDLEIYQKAQTGDFVVPIKEACEREGGYSESFPIGYEVMDRAMKADYADNGGVREGDLIIVTGLSGCGKTTLVQNIALNLNKIGIPSLFFSYEVMIDNLYAKFKEMGYIDDGALICPKKIITGNLKWIKEKIIEGKKKHYVKAVFIDHIDFLSASEHRSSDQLRMALRNICQELKNIAREEEVIIFLLAHVKKVEGREVEMQDISESGGIYQLADYVLAISRAFDEVPSSTSQNGYIKVATDEGMVRMLKNRLTGKQPFFRFRMENNIIKPYNE